LLLLLLLLLPPAILASGQSVLRDPSEIKGVEPDASREALFDGVDDPFGGHDRAARRQPT
jgi:hypothetical protein